MPARSELASALKPYTGATPLEHELGTPQHNTAPLRAMHEPDLSQVCLAAKLHTALADGVDQAGQLPACLPAVPGQNLLQLLWAHTGSFTRLDAAQLPVCAGGLASPQLFVALHTAHVVVVFASAKMPSPSAKLKASRRLPKRLRVSGEQPTGDLARSRAEAAERYARGESNTEGQHSCHQGQRRSGDTATSHTRWQHASWEWHEGWGSENWCSGWHSSTASGSGGTWTSRPQPPKPPSPRWRPRTEDSSATCAPIAAVTAVEPEPGRTSSDMVEIEVEVELPASDKDLSRPPAAGRGDKGPGVEQMEPLLAPTGSRSSAPNSDSGELVTVESDAAIRATQEDERCPAANSDSEELVAVESDMETGAAKDGRCHATYSDSEELIPAATSRDERTRSREGGASRPQAVAQQGTPRNYRLVRAPSPGPQTRLQASCVRGRARTPPSAKHSRKC